MRKAIITGTTRGLGAYLAQAYAGEGWEVVPINRPEFDFSAPPAAWQHKFPKINDFDAMILNAGAAEMALIGLMPVERVEELARVNYIAPFWLLQEALRGIKQPGGRVVALGTIAVPGAFAGEAAYASSKAALHELIRVASREFGPYGVTVNCIAPCLLDGGMAKGLPEKIRSKLLHEQAIKRPATFADVKNVLDFFLSPASDMVTGQILYLGGPW